LPAAAATLRTVVKEHMILSSLVHKSGVTCS